jgi:hypothetical protein
MPAQDRVNQITAALDAMRLGWPFIESEITARIEALTLSLVNNNDEQTRGRIKALRELKELPETLGNERSGISAALSEQDAAN